MPYADEEGESWTVPTNLEATKLTLSSQLPIGKPFMGIPPCPTPSERSGAVTWAWSAADHQVVNIAVHPADRVFNSTQVYIVRKLDPEGQYDCGSQNLADRTIDDDGTYAIGVGEGDIEPGVWRTEGGRDGLTCRWHRLSNTSGTPDAVIASSSSPGQQIVTIAPTDAAFKTEGCTGWTKIK